MPRRGGDQGIEFPLCSISNIRVPAFVCRVPSRYGKFAKNHPGSLSLVPYGISRQDLHHRPGRRTAFLEVERPAGRQDRQIRRRPDAGGRKEFRRMAGR